MKKGLRRFLAVLLALVMVLAFAGCGDESAKRRERREKNRDDDTSVSTVVDPGATSDHDINVGGSGSGSGSGSGAGASLFAGNGKDEITIYKVGDNQLVFAISSDTCEKVANKDSYTPGDNKFEVHIGTDNYATVSLETSYQSASWPVGDEWSWNSNYFDANISKTTYWCEFNYENICNTMSFDGDVTLYNFNRSSGYPEDSNILVRKKASDVVKTVTEEELNTARVNFMEKATANNPAQAHWTGMYMFDAYDDMYIITAEITAGGLVHFNVKTSLGVNDYFLEERDFRTQSYAYGSFESAKCSTSYDGGNGSIEFGYNDDCGNIELYYYNYNYNKDIYQSGCTKPFNGGWHVASNDYDDIDTYGYSEKVDAGDSSYFVPKTEDYLIMYVVNDSVYSGDGYVSTEYRATLYSFDANGMQCDNTKTKYVFANATDASKYAAYTGSNGYNIEYVNAVDNVVYVGSTYGKFEDSKCNLIRNYDWYVDKHLASYSYSSSGQYIYMSKPISQAEYDVSLDDIMTLKAIPYGEHYSTQMRESSLYMTVSNENISLQAYYDYSLAERMYFSYGPQYRFFGDSAIVCAYDSYYKYVYFQEWTFANGLASVVEYRYAVDDYDTMDITFDNYKTKTPDRTLTNEYDLTSAVN